MAIRKCVVEVVQFPGQLSSSAAKAFSGKLEHAMRVDRPYLVVDCSEVRHLDRSGLLLLVCCLEEVMKRNGDVRLATMPLEAQAILEATGIDRLFEVFGTVLEAVNSFHQLPMQATSGTHVPVLSSFVSESAA